MSEPTHSAVIVPFPAAEPAVAPHRALLDPAAGWGVPAHVTVLFPFVPPTSIDVDVIDTLSAAIASVPRFHATCETSGWFGADVLWLDPRPTDPFRALAAAVRKAFPAYKPYGGKHDETTPHLTVGQGVEPARLREAEEQVRRRLPVSMEVAAAGLWCGSDDAGSWRQVAVLPLG